MSFSLLVHSYAWWLSLQIFSEVNVNFGINDSFQICLWIDRSLVSLLALLLMGLWEFSSSWVCLVTLVSITICTVHHLLAVQVLSCSSMAACDLWVCCVPLSSAEALQLPPAYVSQAQAWTQCQTKWWCNRGSDVITCGAHRTHGAVKHEMCVLELLQINGFFLIGSCLFQMIADNIIRY